MALQRYSEEKKVILSYKLRSCLNNISDIFVRSELCEFTYKNSDTLFDRYLSLLGKIELGNDVFFTFVHGLFETSYVASSSLKKIIQKEFQKEVQVSCETDLSSITVRLPKQNIQTPGLYYHILQEIAWEGINLIHVISTSNEFSIIVKDTDVEKAFSVVKKLKKKKTY
jgi:aspartokinase